MYFYFLRFVSFFKSSALLMFIVHRTIIWIFYKKKFIFLTCTLVFFSFNKPLKTYCTRIVIMFIIYIYMLFCFFSFLINFFTCSPFFILLCMSKINWFTLIFLQKKILFLLLMFYKCNISFYDFHSLK